MLSFEDVAKKKGWVVHKAQRLRGDGCQAKGAIVLSNIPGFHPYVVHFFNEEFGIFCCGTYCMTFAEAKKAFETELTYYGRHLMIRDDTDADEENRNQSMRDMALDTLTHY